MTRGGPNKLIVTRENGVIVVVVFNIKEFQSGHKHILFISYLSY